MRCFRILISELQASDMCNPSVAYCKSVYSKLDFDRESQWRNVSASVDSFVRSIFVNLCNARTRWLKVRWCEMEEEHDVLSWYFAASKRKKNARVSYSYRRRSLSSCFWNKLIMFRISVDIFLDWYWTLCLAHRAPYLQYVMKPILNIQVSVGDDSDCNRW